ncbi:uncharacterized protein HMPREF1541_09211 [Cyphellophora europaea CBS 101466]|uniref:RRM domain-containing protein n=1 Tax=Cyphellophora europaea (strain CBS 101466) TaxID=1220924 RepID=W2S9T5_CYPE1|nr:uncharacterized protein HMPREF1541_09211 [Cyphellophora europaea CBS 101466]ETN45380.1 hypothetical protein HMPREF1541_09211 [Cyphellophora europaea CBS 101466]
MTSTSPPPEAQRFGRSQTPESPRPVHLPEPSNIPVLRNQMDPVFNDTATYNIPNDQPFSSFPNPIQKSQPEEHDAVQDFLRGAEAESSIPQEHPVPQVADLQSTEAPSNIPLSPNPPTTTTATTTLPEQPNGTTQSESQLDPTNQVPDQTEPVAAEPTFESQVNGIQAAHDPISQDSASQQQPDLDQGGVDYQSLLDTVHQSASTAPAAESLTAPTTAAASSDPDPSISSLPSAHGLPPKPPVQELPTDYANYPANVPTQAQVSFAASDSLSNAPSLQAGAIPLQDYAYPGMQSTGSIPYASSSVVNQTKAYSPITGERPWSPRTQTIYDQFLEDERGYVTEGIWDKFPIGSRLFVGNLPSEKVTKRDLFHIFHRHGRLAQISIKQAYGFVQFLEASDCSRALEAEQSVEIRGRKIHLEVSKPQKNTRNAANSGAKNKDIRRRSRSPDRRVSNDRFPTRNPFGDLRDERRRDDFRRTRSPSPHRNSYRSRDDYRPHPGRSPPRGYISPRSPAVSQYPPPFPPRYDEDTALPLPRRAPQDVPDVQLLILDQSVPQAFINWVEDAFRAKGLKASTTWLSPRLPLQAVIKRQILEGVHAIVKLLQMNSITHKVPLQVFDRSSGASNVKFNEYVDLDVNVAADIILHTKNTQASPISAYPTTPQSYGGTPHYPPQSMHHSPQQYSPAGQPPLQQRPPQPPQPYPYPQQAPYPPHQPPTPSSANTGAPNLQQLLANLRQPQANGQNPASAQHQQPDLGGLLTNIAAHRQNQAHPYSQHVPQPGLPNYGSTPNAAQGYGPGQQPNNVQNIMDQLARYQR